MPCQDPCPAFAAMLTAAPACRGAAARTRLNVVPAALAGTTLSARRAGGALGSLRQWPHPTALRWRRITDRDHSSQRRADSEIP
jgi:hypothetical protein